MKVYLVDKTKIKILSSIVFGLIVVSMILSYFLFFNKKEEVIFENKFPLIDPARSIVSQENFFSTIEPLRREVKEMVGSYTKEGYRIGLYFEYLNTGANISINQEERFWPASLSKMPTALAVMKKIEDGEWKLSNELVIFSEDRDSGFGNLYRQVAGTKITIEELLNELIINSDDTAHRILIRNLSSEDYEKMLLALGMEEIYDKDYNITAKEFSRILRALYNSSFLDKEYSTYLLEILSKTEFNDFLRAGLPKDVLFSHKIGEHDPELTYLDSGIAYIPNRPYLITIMVDSKHANGRDGSAEIMKNISNVIYSYVKDYK